MHRTLMCSLQLEYADFDSLQVYIGAISDNLNDVVSSDSGTAAFIRERSTGQLIAASVSSTDRSAYYDEDTYSRVVATESPNTLIAWVSVQLANATEIPGEWPTAGTHIFYDTDNATDYDGYFVNIEVYSDTDTLEWDVVFVQAINCALGYEVDANSKTDCIICIPPLTSLGGATSCDRCEEGYFRLDLTGSCEACPTGEYSLLHSSPYFDSAVKYICYPPPTSETLARENS